MGEDRFVSTVSTRSRELTWFPFHPSIQCRGGEHAKKLTELSDVEFDDLAERISKIIEAEPSKANELYRKAAALATARDKHAADGESAGGDSTEAVGKSTLSLQGENERGVEGATARKAQGASNHSRPVVDVSFATAVAAALSRARQNPAKFAKEVLEPILGEFVTKGGNPNVRKRKEKVFLQTNEGPKAVKECIGVMMKTEAMGALTVDALLNEAAMDHVLDCGPKGVMGHAGSDGSQPVDRITRYGQWKGTYGE